MAAEKSFENKVKKYLRNQGCWYIKYWGGSKFTKDGIPDILMCHAGKFMAIELKAPKGKPSLIQIVTLRKIRKAGGIGILLYPFDYEGFIGFMNNKPGSKSWYQENIKFQDRWFEKLDA